MNHAVVAAAIDWTFAVEHQATAVGHEVARILRPLAAEGSPTSTYVVTEVGADPVYDLTLDGRPIGRTHRAHSIVNRLVWSINHELATRADGHVLVHGGCVAIDGRAAVLTGPSGAGKSTLVTALVRSGCTYLTDEAVALDKITGKIAPFPRSISLKPGSWPLFPDLQPPLRAMTPPFTADQWHVNPSAAGPVAAQSDRVMPALVIRLQRTSRGSAQLVPVSKGEMLTTLLHQGLNIVGDAQRAFEILADTVRSTPTYELRYRSADDAAVLIRDRLSAGAT